jgi:hypothetical protein
MKKLIFPISAAFALSVSSLAAQTPTQPHTTPTTPQTGQPQQHQQQQRADQQRGQTMTFTGCLQRGTEAGSYLLTNVQHDAAGTGAMGTPGTPTAPGTPGTTTHPGTQPDQQRPGQDPYGTGEQQRTGQDQPRTGQHAGMQHHGAHQAYRLQAADNVNLSQHVGQRVRVMASVQQQQTGVGTQQDQYRTGDQQRTGQDQYRTGDQARTGQDQPRTGTQPDQPRTGTQPDQPRTGTQPDRQAVGTTGMMASTEAQQQAERAPKLKVQSITKLDDNCR